jgi:hypothetical protein
MGYTIVTVREYLERKPSGKFAILRHDVDRKIKNALKMAELEQTLGIRSTYYFRYPYTFNPEIIRRIASLGHEIGYHYEILAKAKGDYKKALQLFAQELAKFRRIADIKTICMHGSPLSKYDNRELWKYVDFTKFDITGEAYLSIEESINYFTDTGRSWNSTNNVRDKIHGNEPDKQIRTTDDLIRLIESGNLHNLYIVVHPERWSYSIGDWITQYFKDLAMDIGKSVLLIMRKK